jgi:hypothetical protein
LKAFDNKLLRLLLSTILSLTYLLSSLYSTGLALTNAFGYGTSMYPYYGQPAGGVLAAYASVAVNLLWLGFGTFVAVRVITSHMKVSRCVLILALTWLVVLPDTVIYILWGRV